MIQNQMNNQFAAMQHAAMTGCYLGSGLDGLGQSGLMNALGQGCNPSRIKTELDEMRSEVKDWLNDWDK